LIVAATTTNPATITTDYCPTRFSSSDIGMSLVLKKVPVLEILMININGEKNAADIYIQNMQFPLPALAAPSAIPLHAEKIRYTTKLQQVKIAIPTAQIYSCNIALSLIKLTGIATTSVGPRMIFLVLEHEYV
jgi:hypothetical protein